LVRAAARLGRLRREDLSSLTSPVSQRTHWRGTELSFVAQACLSTMPRSKNSPELLGNFHTVKINQKNAKHFRSFLIKGNLF
jgi:hypothetical protein